MPKTYREVEKLQTEKTLDGLTGASGENYFIAFLILFPQ